MMQLLVTDQPTKQMKQRAQSTLIKPLLILLAKQKMKQWRI